MVCFPIMVHTSVSCLLGLGYGCGYICSIASYEIAGKVKNRNKKKEFLKKSPKSDEDYFVVPKIVE